MCKAFGMTVIATRRDPAMGGGAADEVHADTDLMKLIPRADFLVLTTALTPETTGLIGREQLAAMKPAAFLVNVARGKVCDELAITAALSANMIRGAALDVTTEEPLAKDLLPGRCRMSSSPRTRPAKPCYMRIASSTCCSRTSRACSAGESKPANEIV
ncbi:MAG: NAD(P)-dependent oxidoreductase [Hyphomicrobiaceae bacterium]